ncbi:MAG: hypothetical protein K8F91_21945, partial [Candidatus Obscuribacterales bacterium]|nr:hypothetical protein [Candidatus Obscuribacterales bacterium]
MAEDDKVDTSPSDSGSEYRDTDSHLERFFSVETGLKIFNTLDSLAKRGKEGLEFALDLLSELSTELTGVKSFRVIPKPPMEVEVDIRFKKENTIYFRHLVAPLVELESVY